MYIDGNNSKEMYWTVFVWVGMFTGYAFSCAIVKSFFDIDFISFLGILSGMVGGVLGTCVGYIFVKWLNDWLY